MADNNSNGTWSDIGLGALGLAGTLGAAYFASKGPAPAPTPTANPNAAAGVVTTAPTIAERVQAVPGWYFAVGGAALLTLVLVLKR